jgi:hypothetical protein
MLARMLVPLLSVGARAEGVENVAGDAISADANCAPGLADDLWRLLFTNAVADRDAT